MKQSILSNRKGRLRPLLHFTAEKGWINDPNGLIFFNGEYHLFYQYNPYSTVWSSMHWGHATSPDLLHWKALPIALAPTMPYDKDPDGGCFSGSAIEKDGRLYLIYTGSIHKDGKLEQTQNIAWSDDGINFTRYEANPVIRRPENASRDFRDPKVFLHEGTYYAVIGGSIDGDGKVFLYESNDILSWRYKGIVFSSNGKHGQMLECPDFFRLDDKWVLTFSPMMSPDMKKCVYLTGDMDFNNCRFTACCYDDMDKGFDFYAPQSFLDKDGNRILIAWMNRWLWMPFGEDWGPTEQEGWRGALSLPRRIQMKNGSLTFKLIENVKELFHHKTTIESLAVTEEKPYYTSRDGTCLIMLDFSRDSIRSGMFRINIYENASLIIDVISNNAIFSCENGGKGITVAPLGGDTNHHLEISIDNSSLEIFVDNGFSTISMNVFDCSDTLSISVPYKDATIKNMTFLS